VLEDLMRRQRAVTVLAAAAVLWCAAPLVTGCAAPARVARAAAGAAARAGTWHAAIELPGTATLNKGGNAAVKSVSCASAGNCAAGGLFTDGSGHIQAFVASEINGTWHAAIEVPGTGGLNKGGNAAVKSVSCASAGNCAAGGGYTDGSGHHQAFVASETNRTWHAAIEVPGTAALNRRGGAGVSSVSCAAAGNCAAVGGYKDSSRYHQAFVASETNGAWHAAIEVPGTAALNKGGFATVSSVSCAAAGNCLAGGSYFAAEADIQAFVASQTNGTWHAAIEVPGTAALNVGRSADVMSVSCASAGNCAAGGYYNDLDNGGQAFVASERDGAWRKAIEVPGTAALNSLGAEVASLSCASAGNCAAGGFYTDSSSIQAFVASEANGAWHTAVRTAALNKGAYAAVALVSCGSAGNCVAAGRYTDGSGHTQAFVASDANGAWHAAIEVPGTATLNKGGNAGVLSASCASAGNCAAGGFYTDRSGHQQAFVASQN
jgi:hypothetical protein